MVGALSEIGRTRKEIAPAEKAILSSRSASISDTT